MKKPQNWEEVEASEEFGEYETLNLGGHVVEIKRASEYVSMSSGNTSFKVEVDIADGEQKGFFRKQYDNDTRADKKWSNNAIKYISLKEEFVSMFKGFIKIVENSNPGYKWNFDEETLKSKKLVGVFGLEEYQDNDGNVKTSTRLTQFRSLDKLSEVKIPKVKLLNGSTMDYEEYKKMSTQSPIERDFGKTVDIDDCDLD